MRIHLRYFASIREALDKREDVRDVPPGTTVATIWQALVAEHPQLRGQRYRPAVNQEYAGEDTVLEDGDEVVFVPPVSGGRVEGLLETMMETRNTP
ncbi:MAG: MoaD/ThiS family protein [Chloroflexi bacterium]|nr:MoaD/ThiS family protein [Chloroflexota bacterium]